MLAKLTLTKPLVVAGAVAAAIAAAPLAAADTFATGPALNAPAPAHVVFKDDPGGSGCDANGNCGSGGQNGGPGGGPGGQGCIPGVGCGSGGQFAGPGGLPGGSGCLPGVGCGSGHA
ncbi:MAG TPA: PE-PGRS family protein [Mycobacterium sp.]|nr:PE-PGRS family protein [Mycobacterium sp.]HUH68690.1 PE-PGRS family protein [Mycobacterium sp.]